MSGAPPPGADPDLWARLHRPFRPRAGRVAPWVAAVVWVAVLAVLAFTLPGSGPLDVVGFGAVAAGSVWLMSRFAGLSAQPSAEGLVVRNLISVHSLSWQQIVAVTYGRDSTFAHLDLDDGTTLSVLAIQSADGALATHEASRLATLIEAHSRRADPDQPSERS